MDDVYNELNRVCTRYWRIRDSGEHGEARTQAHEELLSLFDSLGIPYDNREQAAMIAKEILHDTVNLWTVVHIIKSQQKARQRFEEVETWKINVIEALDALFESPYQVDLATVPKNGIASNREQVVGIWSVSYVKYEQLRKLLCREYESQEKHQQAQKEPIQGEIA